MKKLLIIGLLIASVAKADIVLYDEPQVTGYQWIAQKKPLQFAASTIETCSYNAAYSGIACIEGTNTSNNETGSKFSILFPKFGWIDPSEFTSLVYHIRQKTVDAGRMNIHPFGNDVTGEKAVGSIAKVGYDSTSMYGLDPHNITGWQTIAVPMSAFAFPPGTIVNRLTWDIVQTSGWYIDLIVLVGTGTIHYPNPYPPAGQ